MKKSVGDLVSEAIEAAIKSLPATKRKSYRNQVIDTSLIWTVVSRKLHRRRKRPCDVTIVLAYMMAMKAIDRAVEEAIELDKVKSWREAPSGL